MTTTRGAKVKWVEKRRDEEKKKNVKMKWEANGGPGYERNS